MYVPNCTQVGFRIRRPLFDLQLLYLLVVVAVLLVHCTYNTNNNNNDRGWIGLTFRLTSVDETLMLQQMVDHPSGGGKSSLGSP